MVAFFSPLGFGLKWRSEGRPRSFYSFDFGHKPGEAVFFLFVGLGTNREMEKVVFFLHICSGQKSKGMKRL